MILRITILLLSYFTVLLLANCNYDSGSFYPPGWSGANGTLNNTNLIYNDVPNNVAYYFTADDEYLYLGWQGPSIDPNDGFLVIKDNSQTVFRTGAWYGNSEPSDSVPTFPDGYSYTIAYFGGSPTDVCLINASQSQIPPTTCGSTPDNTTAQYLIFQDYQGWNGNGYVSVVRFPRSLFGGQIAPCAEQTHTLQAIFYITEGSNNVAYSVFPTIQQAYNIFTNYTYIKLPDPKICSFTCSPSVTSSHHSGTTSSHHNGTTSSHHSETTSSHHNGTASSHHNGTTSSHHNKTMSSHHETSSHHNKTTSSHHDESSSINHKTSSHDNTASTSDSLPEILPNSILIFASTTFIAFILMISMRLY